ncbi:WD40 repeat domain-containing protein [Nonomuraea terrae]|uniref:WD40 repeat domain-containing protein n=1 Tax=Nonomuraea terrae TaxID=2530383 RepID=A0A4R4Z5X7_9ACTN|nr:WD40 repeat domain-containing protein [Nonomuraea terrae]TDD53538.1 WD40 repeat domain-containing protein [Nonomuraea terrae]
MRGKIDGFTHDLDSLGDLVVTPDGSNFFSVASAQRRTDLWDANSLERIRSYAGESATEGFPSSVAISPDGAYVVVGEADGADLVIYDAVTGAMIHALNNLAVAGSTGLRLPKMSSAQVMALQG